MNTYMFSRSIAPVLIALVWLVSTPSLLQAQGDVLDLPIPTIPPTCTECYAELTEVLRARDQVQHVREERANTRAELDEKNTEWDVRHGRGVGTDSGNFARGDGIEVRYVDGKIQKFVDGQPSGPPRPSRTLDRLRAEIEALEDRIRDLEVEIPLAESGVEAALKALQDCIDRCLTIPELQVPKVNFIDDRLELVLETDFAFASAPFLAFPQWWLFDPTRPVTGGYVATVPIQLSSGEVGETVTVGGAGPCAPPPGDRFQQLDNRFTELFGQGEQERRPEQERDPQRDDHKIRRERQSQMLGLEDAASRMQNQVCTDIPPIDRSLVDLLNTEPNGALSSRRGDLFGLSTDGASGRVAGVLEGDADEFWASGSDDVIDWESAWDWVLRDDDVFDGAPRIHAQYGEVWNDPGSLGGPTLSDRIFAESARSFIRANWGGLGGSQGGDRYGNEFDGVRLNHVPDGLEGFAGDGSGFDWENVSPRIGLTYALGSSRKSLDFGARGYGDQLYDPFAVGGFRGGYDIGDLSGGSGATPSLDLSAGNGFYDVQPNGTTVRITIPTAGYDDQYQRIITVRVRVPPSTGGIAAPWNFEVPGDVSVPAPPSWWARAQQGVGSLFFRAVETLSASLVPSVQAPPRHGALRPGTVVRLAEAQPGTGAPMLSVVATGASSGETFTLQTLGTALDVVAPDGLVLEAIEPGQLQPISETASGPVTTTPMTGYCVDFSKPQPPAGALYQVAPEAVQEEYGPLVSVLKAGRDLAEAGLLNPDSDLGLYNTFIQQWALWSRLEDWDLGEFTEAFIDRTRENIENLGGEWVAEMGEALRGAAPNRYDDILTVLLEAESLAASEAAAQ